MDITDIKALIESQGRTFEEFKNANNARMEEIEKRSLDIAKKANRPGAPGNPDERKDAGHQQWYDRKTKTIVPVLDHSQAVATLEPETKDAAPSVGRVLRGLVMGSQADDAMDLAEERKALRIGDDSAGGYTVSGVLASRWIDLLRAQMVLSRAGALTVPMESKSLSLAKVTGDPTVFWHSENGAITSSDPTFGAVNLEAKTAVCLVKMSLELSQDSSNIESILQSTIISAMASAIDQAGLVGVSSSAGAAPMTGTGIVNLSGRNTVTGVGAPTSWDFLIDGLYELALDNVPLESVGAMVAHPALWKKMAKLKTGITNDNTPLAASPDVQRIPKLYTTAAPLSGGDATAVIADWRDLLFGVRKNITVQVLRESFLGSNLQIAILAYARVDFAATRAQSFCTMEGITV